MKKTASVIEQNSIADTKRAEGRKVSSLKAYAPRAYAEAVGIKTGGVRRVRGMYGSMHADQAGFGAGRMRKARAKTGRQVGIKSGRRAGAYARTADREIVRGRPLDLDRPAGTLRSVTKFLTIRNLLAFLFAAAAVGAALVIMLFNFEHATVYGNTKYSQEQIESFITRGRMGENTFVMALKYHHRKVEDIPFIDQIDIDIVNPSTVRVNIKEKPLDACIYYGGRNVYFSKEGMIETVSGRDLEEATKINGVVLTHSDTGKQVLARNQYGLDLSLELLRILDKYNMHADTIDVDEKSCLTVSFGDVKVMIGKNGFDQKMYKIHQILPDLEGRSGMISMTGFAYDYGTADIVLSPEKAEDEPAETGSEETEQDGETGSEETEQDGETGPEENETDEPETSGTEGNGAVTEKPETEKSEEKKSAAEKAGTEENEAENPEAKDPVTEKAGTEKAETEKSEAKKSEAEKPAAEEAGPDEAEQQKEAEAEKTEKKAEAEAKKASDEKKTAEAKKEAEAKKSE